MRSGWLFPHCIGVAVLVIGALSGPVVLGDDADRTKKLEELEKSHNETVADLQRELNKQLAVFDAQVLTAVENGGAGRSKTPALGGVDIPWLVVVSRPL